MNSSKINFLFFKFAIIALFIAFPACDVIEEGKYEETGGTPDIITGQPKILLEDFTGHKCVNCPEGTNVYHALQEQYPGQIIVVGIHGGAFTEPDADPAGNYKLDLRTNEGARIVYDYGADGAGKPSALISRNSATPLMRGQWAAEVTKYWETYTTAPLNITLSSSVDTATNKLTADVQLDYATATSSKNLVSVWLVEDGIIGYQKTAVAPFDIPDYEHNNVLRASFNGIYGEEVSTENTVPANYKWNKNYSFDLPTGNLAPGKKMNPNNLRIVAFVYDANSKVVMQAEETKVTVK